MRYRILLFLLLLVPLNWAQIVTIQGNDTLQASRTTLNNNFAYLDAKTNLVTSSTSGIVPAFPNDTSQVLLGNGAWGHLTAVPIIGWQSNVLNQSASQSTVTLASAPGAGFYRLVYYADLTTPCTTGSNTVSFQFNWTDAGSSRALQTGSFTLGAAQTTGHYIEGTFGLWVASGDVTYTSTVTGTCTSGTSSYDIHVTLESI